LTRAVLARCAVRRLADDTPSGLGALPSGAARRRIAVSPDALFD
jgi:hypothetical protein